MYWNKNLAINNVFSYVPKESIFIIHHTVLISLIIVVLHRYVRGRNQRYSCGDGMDRYREKKMDRRASN